MRVRLSLGFKDLELAGGVFLGRNVAGCDVAFFGRIKKWGLTMDV